ncbi:MAG TPA: farnesyl diphosphate synthase [Longimicrobiales bacterium]|nr:farnesyl diphosphate synthase [Longimicrobiales bacterium]
MTGVATPDARAALGRERARVEARLTELADGLAEVPAALRPAFRYALGGGGKRLRPVLCVLAYRALGGTDEDGIYDVACAIELVHTYSLVHDDLPAMDDDDLRRGRPTLHRIGGTGLAAAAGAALIPFSFRVLVRGIARLRLDDAAGCELVGELARGMGGGGMVGGQWLDLEAEGRPLDLAALERIHAAKTGALFAAALRMGARAARATPDQIGAAGAWGAALGHAFQVIDDVLDETADSAVLGKTAGKDRRQAKATYPALLGREVARAYARTRIEAGRDALRAAGIASGELEAVGELVLARDH